MVQVARDARGVVTARTSYAGDEIAAAQEGESGDLSEVYWYEVLMVCSGYNERY